MLIEAQPTAWKELQDRVAIILNECGFEAETPKTIPTARGSVEVDVFATDNSQTPEAIFLIECKLWSTSVTKEKVHAFRSVIEDYGANFGLVVSSGGFQRGAIEAANHTNISLLNWEGFNALYRKRWITSYMAPRIAKHAGPLNEYTEPINSRILRKTLALPEDSQVQIKELQVKYLGLAFASLVTFFQSPFLRTDEIEFDILAERTGIDDLKGSPVFPQDVMLSASLREFAEHLIKHLDDATAEFDAVFGERA